MCTKLPWRPHPVQLELFQWHPGTDFSQNGTKNFAFGGIIDAPQLAPSRLYILTEAFSQSVW